MAIRSGRLAVAGSLVLACALAANVAAQAPSGGQKPVVKGVRAVPIQSVEGKDNFEAYCAVCHGRDAKGTGPAAPAMTRSASRRSSSRPRATRRVAISLIASGRSSTPRSRRTRSERCEPQSFSVG